MRFTVNFKNMIYQQICLTLRLSCFYFSGETHLETYTSLHNYQINMNQLEFKYQGIKLASPYIHVYSKVQSRNFLQWRILNLASKNFPITLLAKEVYDFNIRISTSTHFLLDIIVRFTTEGIVLNHILTFG